jgi:hypothetical protein
VLPRWRPAPQPPRGAVPSTPAPLDKAQTSGAGARRGRTLLAPGLELLDDLRRALAERGDLQHRDAGVLVRGDAILDIDDV